MIYLTASPPVQTEQVTLSPVAQPAIDDPAAVLATSTATSGGARRRRVSVATQPTPAVAAPPPALPRRRRTHPERQARARSSRAAPTGWHCSASTARRSAYAQVDGKNYDMATGLNPLDVPITPDGKLAIVNNIGGGQNGQVDTVGVIDLEASPPPVTNQVVVGDGPEGLAMSPTGGYAASLILNGTGGAPRTARHRHEKSYVALLKIDGKTVRKVAHADVGLSEGIALSPNGQYLYIGNFVDGDIDILRLNADTLAKVTSFALPGHPASMRGSTP